MRLDNTLAPSCGIVLVQRCPKEINQGTVGKVTQVITNPNLEFDSCVVNVNGLRQEGGTDCALLVLVELAFHESQHKRGLADGRLAQKHQLKLTDLALCRAIRALNAAATSLVVCHRF